MRRFVVGLIFILSCSFVYAQDEAPIASNSSRMNSLNGGKANVFYRQLVLSPKNPSILFASTSDNTIEIWNLDQNRLEKSFSVGQYPYQTIATSDALYIRQTRAVTVWNVEGRLLRNMSIPSNTSDSFYPLAIDTASSTLYSSFGTQIQVYHSQTGQFLRNFTTQTIKPLKNLFVADNNRVISVDEDKTLYSWDPSTGEQKGIERISSTSALDDAVLSNGILYTCLGDKTVRSYKASTLSLDKAFVGGRVDFYKVAAGQNGLFAVGNDFRIRQWDLTTGQLVRIYNQTDEVASIVVTQDDRVIVGTFTHSMDMWKVEQNASSPVDKDSKSMDLRLVLGITIPLVVLLLIVVVALIVHQRRTRNKNNNQDDMNAYLPAYVKAAKENAKSSPPRKKWFDWWNKPASSSLESNVPSATSSDTLHSDSHPLHSSAPLLAQEGIPNNDIQDKRQSGIPLNA